MYKALCLSFQRAILIAIVLSTVCLGQPRVSCEQPVFDFGTVDGSQPIEHVFAFRNEGDAPLQFQKVKPACGCTKTELGVTTIAPGEETTLAIELSLAGAKGRQIKSITLESNDPVTPKLELRLIGTVTSPVSVTPDRLHFGKVSIGEKAVRSFDLSVSNLVPFDIRSVSSTLSNVDCNLEVVVPGSLFRVVAMLEAPSSACVIRGTIQIETNNDQYPVIEVPLTAEVPGPIIYTPHELLLVAGTSSVLTRYIMLSPESVTQFEIKGIEVPNDQIESQVQVLGQRGYRVRLSNLLVSDDLNGKTVAIRTDAPGMNEITIPIRVVPADSSSPVAPTDK